MLVASDGLWDNIDVEKIHYYLKGPTSYTIKKTNKVISDSYHEEKEEKVYKTLLELARGLVKTAERCAHLKDYESPIYLKALKAKQNAVKAGIMDDVTVILARIAQREREDDKD